MQINDVVLTKNQMILITASADKTLKSWDVNNQQCLLTFNGHNAFINCLTISDDDKYAI